MEIAELEQRIAEIRSRSLLAVCVMPNGKRKTMTVQECAKTGSKFVHIAADELDELLGAELGGDKEYP